MEKKMAKNPQALVLDPRDNVATLLLDAPAGEIIALKDCEGNVKASVDITYGHKVAMKPIREGGDILKYGHRIGIATKDINTGDWVHLHNMSSAVDITFKKRIMSRAR